MSTTKPTVSFDRVGGWEDHGLHGITAVLRGVWGHPRLGNEPLVYTSRVQAITYTEDGHVESIETHNTLYRRAQGEQVGP